ncbi:MAG: RagB/SusD family nutrient uptake outer membrane protein [Gemmatimonadetes bacterium]|nr:RagB/SusD family nutrient uptake outer membrane protein [Gemmatimonadota bacterium]
MTVLLTVVACKGVLDVPNPQAFGNDALNNAIILKTVTDGAEGLLQHAYDDYIVVTELESDEMTSTSTWIDWEDISAGRLRHDWPTAGSFSDPQDQLLRARFAAQSAQDRVQTVLGASAATSPLRAQVLAVDAIADLLLGMGWCESPLAPNAPRSPDSDVIKQSITKFTAALAAAQAISGDAASQAKWTAVAYAGRARANLLAGNYAAAATDAAAVPAGWEYDAIYAEGAPSTQSLTGNQFNQNRNRSGGLREIYQSRVHVIDSTSSYEAYLRDWFDPTKDDHRMAVMRTANQLGVNNRIPYYGVTKYASRSAPIRMLSKVEATLIQAEAAMRTNDFVTEASLLNGLRARAGVALPAIAVPTTAAAAQTALLNERMAELFVEGHRLEDLYRFNLVGPILGTGRATKLPLSRNEILANPKMVDGGGSCPSIS